MAGRPGDEPARRLAVNDAVRHHLRNQFAIGRGYAAVLRTSYAALSDTQRDHAVEGLAQAFGRVERFARRVLADEQLDAGYRPRVGEVVLARPLDAVRAEYPALAVETAPDAPETVAADPQLLADVLDNLVANAVAAAGAATLRVHRDGLIEVRDSGPGIEPDELPVIWER